jgi:hypothetical protein
MRWVGGLLIVAGIAWSMITIVRDDPRTYAVVRTYFCKLCVTPDQVIVVRPVNGAEPDCLGLRVDAQVELVMSVPRHRPPSADRLPEAGPERAVVVTLTGDDLATSYYWQTGATDVRPRSKWLPPEAPSEQLLPQATLERVLPVLADDMADQAGAELGAGVRAGGIATSTLPPLRNSPRWLPFIGAGVVSLGLILIELARLAQRLEVIQGRS